MPQMQPMMGLRIFPTLGQHVHTLGGRTPSLEGVMAPSQARWHVWQHVPRQQSTRRAECAPIRTAPVKQLASSVTVQPSGRVSQTTPSTPPAIVRVEPMRWTKAMAPFNACRQRVSAVTWQMLPTMVSLISRTACQRVASATMATPSAVFVTARLLVHRHVSKLAVQRA